MQGGLGAATYVRLFVPSIPKRAALIGLGASSMELSGSQLVSLLCWGPSWGWGGASLWTV